MLEETSQMAGIDHTEKDEGFKEHSRKMKKLAEQQHATKAS